ncbi:hypothetical protein [Streptomyces sp. NPDC003015]
MSERRVIACSPPGTGGGGVGIEDRMLGARYRVHDLEITVCRRNTGLTGRDELGVAESGRVGRHAGEPEVWRR